MRLLVNKLTKQRLKISYVKEIVKQVLSLEGVREGEISIVLADDAFVQELNKQYRGIDASTDVLAFNFREESSNLPIQTCLGEIVISCQQTRGQAEEYGHSFEEELRLLLVHGTLHLLGYDHQGNYPGSEERIFTRAEEIIDQIQTGAEGGI